MKPIIRWTLGKTSKEGVDCLKESIKSWELVYGDQFEKKICYNQIDPKILNNLNVHLIDQSKYENSICHKPNLTSWKFYPPRLNKETHEIFIDNDLIIYKKSPSVEKFLKSKKLFISTTDEGVTIKEKYGRYKNLIPNDLIINSGLFGFPPHYNFQSELKMFFRLFSSLKGWSGHFDEEGVLASLLSRKNLLIIPMEEISICNPNPAIDQPYNLGSSGIHFAGLNRGRIEFWNKYKESSKHYLS